MDQTRFHFLLFSLIVMFVLFPFFTENLLVFNLAFSIIVLSSLHAILYDQKTFMAASIFALITVISNWLSIVSPHPIIKIVNFSVFVLFYAYVVSHLLRFVLSSKSVTSSVISAAISSYFLIGICWGFLYSLIQTISPDSFIFSEGIIRSSYLWPDFIYYSFVTLTTVGFGDILPHSSLARSVTLLEAIFGTFFIAVLVAKLVSLYRFDRKD
jgi:hypothetical protein